MGLFSQIGFSFKGFSIFLKGQFFFRNLAKNKTSKILEEIKNSKDLFKYQTYSSLLTPLHVLIRDNKEDLLKEAAKRKDIKEYIDNNINSSKWAPIHFAAYLGSTNILKQLLPHKPNLNIKSSEGLTALHISASKGFNDFISLLLEYGAHIDEKDNTNHTALHYSIPQNHLETVKYLIKNGADVNNHNSSGITPLMSSIVFNNLEMVKLLYNFKREYKGNSPYDLIHLASMLKESQILEWLHNQGEDIWLKTKDVNFT